MRPRFILSVVVCVTCCAIDLAAQRPVDRHPDLQGFWTNGTATPLQRPTEFKDKPVLTADEAAAYEKGGLERLLASIPEEDRIGADLNDIYLETSSLKLVEGRRSALIVDPPDGRLPPLLPQAQARAAARKRSYDDPETFSLDERCLLGTATGSSQVAAPIVPNFFGLNYYQIVQTPQHVVILHRGEPRRADYPDRWPPSSAERAPVAWRLDWPMGRRHARRRHHELHGEVAFSRIGPRYARRGAIPPRGCDDDSVSRDG